MKEENGLIAVTEEKHIQLKKITYILNKNFISSVNIPPPVKMK